ncbi:BglB-family transcriptional antiterminator [Klebsiella pneumoniae]|uniref:BglB-family transcriptional antiterminator n=1 Tax=Klebsiella pneumoniae TaxID=573 RepID=A0A2X3ETY2_KLEPN|nr:BglB-family transcriptional antiterminator [Klebsiella pneumoniae]
MRFPNQRLAQLFTLLRNETLPQDELAQRLSVSTRTVRADITALIRCWRIWRAVYP